MGNYGRKVSLSESTISASAALPENPDLRYLRDEARALVASGDAPTHAKALFAVARRYGFASWAKLKAEVEARQEAGRLKAAIDAEDWDAVRALMTANPALHRAPLGYGESGPLTWLAECRVPWKPPTSERLQMAAWMIAHGSDVHQGGDGPLMRAALHDYRVPMMDLLVAHGADVNALWNGNYPIILAPCETLAPESLRWLLAHGARIDVSSKYGDPRAMLIGTYARGASGKRECLAVLAEYGVALPDTPVMALHAGRFGLLEAHLRRDSGLLSRRFALADIFPAELGMAPDAVFTWTPLDGTTLLHVAAEFADEAITAWLIEHGADVNARAVAGGGDRSGDQTPLFHAAIFGAKTDAIARLLLRNGADPNARAILRIKLTDAPDPAHNGIHGFQDVTPLGYAIGYPEGQWVNEAAVAAIIAAGGAL